MQCKAAGAWLCEPCAGALRRVPDERCPRCGAPGRFVPAGDAAARQSRLRASGGLHGGERAAPWVPRRPFRAARPCPECSGRELAFTSATAAFCYEGPARSLVAVCKLRALRSLAGEMARLAQPAFASVCAGLEPGDVVVTWVPGHRDHTLERGFNQAQILATRLAASGGVPAAPLLRRLRHGSRQSGLGREARAANVRGAFALREEAAGVSQKFKRVIVVDDVYTTGETLDQCSQVLAAAGFSPHAFSFARTVRAGSRQASPAHPLEKERCR